MFSARMGESMAAYQSPSKDLSFINGRLQQRHPFRAGAPDAAPGAPAFVLQNLDPNSVRPCTPSSHPAHARFDSLNMPLPARHHDLLTVPAKVKRRVVIWFDRAYCLPAS